jgi:hypothetical protein
MLQQSSVFSVFSLVYVAVLKFSFMVQYNCMISGISMILPGSAKCGAVPS